MRILFLTNLLPWPLDNGGKIKTYTTLCALSNAGHTINLLCFKETQDLMQCEESKISKVCKSVKQVYLPLTTVNHQKYMVGIATKSLFSILPFSIFKYQSNEMFCELKQMLKTEYDVIYFDHLPMCVYLDCAYRENPNARIILDEHNCETIITQRKSIESQNLIKKLFLCFEAYKTGKFEAKSLKQADNVILLSDIDYKSTVKLVGREFPHSIIPIGVPDRGMKSSSNNEDLNILFIGTLTWEPNNAGLLWFLRDVMPILEAKKLNIHLFIVGKNPSNEVKRMCDRYKDKVTITGYVESVDEYYDKCDCTIVPLFIGSGQRVKLIEAFSKGMPAISTTIGAEGLVYDENSIIIADDKHSFAEAIEQILDSHIREQLRNNSRKVYEEHYSPNVISRLIKDAIEREHR